MRRLVIGLACLSPVCLAALAAEDKAPVDVLAKSGGADGHRWESQGRKSPPMAAVGNPADRLEVKVKNGDVISFKVESGKHGVLFEKAKKEQDDGVWVIVKDSGELKELPKVPAFDRFDRKNARTTDALTAGKKLIEIRIKNLKGGAANGILFACNPHSAQGEAAKTSMLGVIVLATDDKKAKGK